ncbi:MAG: glycosyltransferase family 4 protein [Alphaproteobacteria bacterium]
MNDPAADSRPLLLYLVTEDWAFMSHRLPVARGAEEAGMRVGVMTRVGRHGGDIQALGYDLYPLQWVRRSLNPLRILRDLTQIIALYRRLRPRIAQHVALKAVLIGGLAARFADIPAQIAAINGVGFVFTDPGLKARLMRLAFVPMLRFVLRREHVMAWFQNADDRDLFIRLGIVVPEQTVILRGAGVDTDILQPAPEAAGPITCAYAGRMLRSKGVDALVEAVRRCRAEGMDLRLLLAGSADDNPTSFSQQQLEAWNRMEGIEHLGHISDIGDLWRRAHIAVLPCRVREGMPKTLLDAAACGRPIVASDLEGVREVARHGHNAILVPPGDTNALAAALAALTKDAARRQNMGRESRAMVMGEMSAAAIQAGAAAIYRRIIASSRSAPDSLRRRGPAS